MSWYDHPIDSLEAEASEVQSKFVTWVDAAGDTARSTWSDVQGEAQADYDKAVGYAELAKDLASDPLLLAQVPALVTEVAIDAVSPTARKALDDVAGTAGKKLKQAGTLLDLITNPWVIGGAAVLIGLAVAGPYVLPFIRKGT